MLEIIVEITPEGETQQTVKGLKGKQCLTHPVVQGLDKVLGKRKTRAHTSEFYACATQVVTQVQSA
jgi:hypothetical protein